MSRSSAHFASRFLFPLLIGIGLFIAACGGGSSSSNNPTALTEPVPKLHVVSPYKIKTFKGVPPAGATQPDDLAISADGADLWVGYGNGVDTFGKGGPSNLVEYDIGSTNVLRNISIPGHLDGLKINPVTNDVWATENEDGNPTLAIVNPLTGNYQLFAFASSLLTGGMDDLVFTLTSPQQVFIVTSSQTDITLPVIVQISGTPATNNPPLTPFLAGNPASVVNVVTNTVETSDQIGDPDSMILDPAGELVLDNRSDDSLYIVNPSVAGPVRRVPLTLNGNLVEVNDTIFTISTFGVTSASGAGAIFITDTTANAIYILTKPFFAQNEVYTAADVVNDVGLVDLTTGVVTPVVTGFEGVHGLAFLP